VPLQRPQQTSKPGCLSDVWGGKLTAVLLYDCVGYWTSTRSSTVASTLGSYWYLLHGYGKYGCCTPTIKHFRHSSGQSW
jgi:hypothetical protein